MTRFTCNIKSDILSYYKFLEIQAFVLTETLCHSNYTSGRKKKPDFQFIWDA